MKQEEIIKIIQNESLIMSDVSRACIDWSTLLTAKNSNIFFGIGLCTSDKPSIGIPFDILLFFLIAEKLRRIMHFSKVIILIADTHAQSNAFMNQKTVNNIKLHTMKTVQNIIRNLSFKNTEVLFASEIRLEDSFQKISKNVPQMSNKYLQEELTDIMWLIQHKNVSMKLGWSIDNTLKPVGHDERFFDMQLRTVCTVPISFIFTKSGRTLTLGKPKASPYIATKDEERILIDPHENVKQKLQQAEKKFTDLSQLLASKRQFKEMVRLFEKLFFRLPQQTLEEKMQFIISVTTQV